MKLIVMLLTLKFIFSQLNIDSKMRFLQTINNNNQCSTFQCGSSLCSTQHSNCVYGNCVCIKGYITFPIDSPSKCCYEQKKQLTAFLVEFFVGFGAGHFYIGRYDMAAPKLAIYLVLCLLNCLSLCLIYVCKKQSQGLRLAFNIGVALLGCVIFCWQLADAIVYGLNQYYDGNGVSLDHW